MEPQVLRCEARLPRSGFGLWRYSLAALILGAAMLDALWWVPAHQREAREPAVRSEISRCPHAQPTRAEPPRARPASGLILIPTTW